MENEFVKENDDVLLILDEKRKYLVKVTKNMKLHTHKGYIEHNKLIGKKFGEIIKTNLNVEFFIAKPTLYDYIKKFPRITQIIYPKDAAYIVFIANISNNSRVIEIGTGSGALTCVLANAVKPNGHIYSYEIRKEFIKIAKENLKRTKVLEYVTLKEKDALEGIDERNVDSVIADVPNPWEFIKEIKKSLKNSGIFVAFCPTINQLEKLVSMLKENNFKDINAIELIERSYQIETNKIRPKTLMIGHTGYIIWCRKGN